MAKYKALSVKQPYATLLVTGKKTIEVRSRFTNYRGDLFICSSATSEETSIGLPTGVALGFVTLIGCREAQLFTEDDWNKTLIPVSERERLSKRIGWLMSEPRLLKKPIPIKGKLGIYNVELEELKDEDFI